MNFSQKTNYVRTKGIYLIEVMGYSLSSEIANYNKAPFIKFKCITEPKEEMVELMFWLARPTDSEIVSKIKKEKLDKFFEHLLGSNTLKGKEVLEACVGKKCKVALKQKERLVIKEGSKPMIYNDMELWYSGYQDKPLNADETKMFISLNDADRNKYLSEKSKWEKENYKKESPVDKDLDFLDEKPKSKEFDVLKDDLPF